MGAGGSSQQMCHGEGLAGTMDCPRIAQKGVQSGCMCYLMCQWSHAEAWKVRISFARTVPRTGGNHSPGAEGGNPDTGHSARRLSPASAHGSTAGLRTRHRPPLSLSPVRGRIRQWGRRLGILRRCMGSSLLLLWPSGWPWLCEVCLEAGLIDGPPAPLLSSLHVSALEPSLDHGIADASSLRCCRGGHDPPFLP